MISDGLGKLFRRAGWFPELPKGVKRVNRPAVFVLLFWSCWAATLAIHAFGLLDQDPRKSGTAPVVAALIVLAVIWVALPWDPRARTARKLAAPAFLVGTLAVGYLTNLNLSVFFYAIVFANGVFLFGFGRGILYAAAVLPVFFLNVLLSDGAADALVITAVAVPFVVFVVGVCATIVEATRRREQTQELFTELETANAELRDHAARVRELSVSEERARMAREIHDSVGHHLTVVNMQLQNARRFRERRPEKPDEAWEKVEEARELALEALSEVRRSVRALKPLAVEGETGPGALAALARNFEGTGIDVAFSVEGTDRELPGEAELVLYRAMQEGLTNAAKHSGARRVSAVLSFGELGTRLSVADDGSGAHEGAPERGFGLSALRERVESLGGTLSSGNRPGGGFVLAVDLPASPEPHAASPARPPTAGRA